MEGSGTSVQALPSAHLPRQTRQRRRHRDRPRAPRLHVGHRQGGAYPDLTRIHNSRVSAEARPRFGVTLEGVKRRPRPTLVPRSRQAPDGNK
jgi:hypothetical protein